MAIQVFHWLSKHGSHINKNCKENWTSKNHVLPGAIIKVWKCNICEFSPIQDQGCQLLSKFIDNMDYIIIKNISHIIQAEFSQVLATVHNKADCSPT